MIGRSGSVRVRCEKQQDFLGFFKVQPRILACKYAVRKNLSHPSKWNETEKTEKDRQKGSHRRNSNQILLFYFPQEEDFSYVKKNDFVIMLPPTTSILTKKRLAGLFKFLTYLSKNRLLGHSDIVWFVPENKIVFVPVNSFVSAQVKLFCCL